MIEPIDFSAYMVETDAQHKVRPASTWQDQYFAKVRGEVPHIVGARLPWAKVGDRVAFAPGEVSLWVGTNGHGKSLLLGQCALSFASQGEKVCIASFEMRPDKTVERLSAQFLDTRNPTMEQAVSFMDWTDGKVWLYDQLGNADGKTLMGAIRYCARELGVKHFVVDNLIKCVRSDEDYEGQKAFVDQLTSIAKDESIHIHLVHHARKTANEFEPPRKMDTLGAGSIVNLVDNLLIVWRNKKKEDDRSMGKQVNEMEPDATVIVDKNRHLGWEGKISLWFHYRSTQYIAHPRDMAMNFTAWPHDNSRGFE